MPIRVRVQKSPERERVPSEDAEQEALFRWARCRVGMFPELSTMFAIPNGGFRRIETGARLKRTGVKAGVPDIFLPVARRGFHGLFIEMKRRKGGHVSPAQSEFMDRLAGQGFCCIVCRGWFEAAGHLEDYLKDE